jgi:hypothetical protein
MIFKFFRPGAHWQVQAAPLKPFSDAIFFESRLA